MIDTDIDELPAVSWKEYNDLEAQPYFSIEEMIIGMPSPDDGPEITDYADRRGI